MAFENLTGRLQDVFRQLRGKGRLTEKDVKDALREVKLALLEADVNFKVVKSFTATVLEKATGSSVLEGLNPGQQVIKIVHDELVSVLGQTQSRLTFASRPPTVYMMVGLQGSGKTTTCAKLAGLLKGQGKKPLLAACDVYRPAAVKQLEIAAKHFNTPVFNIEGSTDPAAIAEAAVSHARGAGCDVVIVDTAGRLHIDEALMDELVTMKDTLRPQEILLVVDAMTGQDAVNAAQAFDARLGVDGIIITKLDGDARGGAALSVRAVTGRPVKLAGTGEKPGDLEPFYPDRMASRILGMGDVMTLIEKAQTTFDEKQAIELERKMRQNRFTLQDFLTQMQQVKNMGPLKNVLGMIPGLSQAGIDDSDIDEKAMLHIEAIILSMTQDERDDPGILNGSRKKRIAAGSGRSIQEVNRLLKQFEEMKKLMKQLTDRTRGKKGKMNLPFLP